MRPTFLVVLLVCSLVSCSRPDLTYAPPPQRKLLPSAKLIRHLPMADMGDATIVQYLVKDIDPGPGQAQWRWTGREPTVKVAIRGSVPMKILAEFAIADATFKDTGPLDITFTVNDHAVKTVHYDHPGSKTFEAPVPPAFLKLDGDNLIAAKLDKVWVAPGDGAQLGILLTKMGLQAR